MCIMYIMPRIQLCQEFQSLLGVVRLSQGFKGAHFLAEQRRILHGVLREESSDSLGSYLMVMMMMMMMITMMTMTMMMMKIIMMKTGDSRGSHLVQSEQL